MRERGVRRPKGRAAARAEQGPLLLDTSGVTTVEYIIVLVLIAIVGIIVWRTLGDTVSSKAADARDTLASMAVPDPADGDTTEGPSNTEGGDGWGVSRRRVSTLDGFMGRREADRAGDRARSTASRDRGGSTMDGFLGRRPGGSSSSQSTGRRSTVTDGFLGRRPSGTSSSQSTGRRSTVMDGFLGRRTED